jgi:hypothetical protein
MSKTSLVSSTLQALMIYSDLWCLKPQTSNHTGVLYTSKQSDAPEIPPSGKNQDIKHIAPKRQCLLANTVIHIPGSCCTWSKIACVCSLHILSFHHSFLDDTLPQTLQTYTFKTLNPWEFPVLDHLPNLLSTKMSTGRDEIHKCPWK